MNIKLQVFLTLKTKLCNRFLKENINTSNLKNGMIVKFNNFMVSGAYVNIVHCTKNEVSH